jgi:23S rRNA (guanosine2251-2'-O)-methyltransferase
LQPASRAGRPGKTGKKMREDETFQEEDLKLEGKNAVLEALRSGRDINRLYVQEHAQSSMADPDRHIAQILREAKKNGVVVNFVKKERLDAMSDTGKHQGVIALAAAGNYTDVEDILKAAKDRNEAPFVIVLDDIEDPHNLGAIIRTAECAGAHGVIIPKRRASGLTGVVSKASAGAVSLVPVARVTNLARTIEDLKKEGLWFVCADMDGTPMYDLDLKGPVGLVIGNEGKGVSRLVKEQCDYVASIPMKGKIGSLNASVAAGVLAYEIVRQRGL